MTKEEKMKDSDVYPCTIIQDRFGGAYSEAKFIAFHLDHIFVPDAIGIGGGDGPEMQFWEEGGHEDYIIGKGNTPNQAYYDLKKKLKPQMKKRLDK